MKAMERPTPAMVEAYGLEIGWEIDGEYFCDYWAARGWYLKHNQPMRDWKATVRNWKRMDRRQQTAQGPNREKDAEKRRERMQYLGEYSRQILALREWIGDPACPYGDPKEEEMRLWSKARRNFGAGFVAELKEWVRAKRER